MRRALAAGFALAAALAIAQEPPPAAPAPPPTPVPIVDAAKALSGRALVEALRGGGYVLLMRHAQQGRYTPACTEPNLTAEGEAQARKVGAALKALRIPIGVVRSSLFCRAIETATHLDAGPVSNTADLNPGSHAERRVLVAEPPKAGTNTILVSHGQSSPNVEERVLYEIAEAIVFQPDGRGGAAVVARIRLQDWDALPR